MNLSIVTVGTRGDVQPYVALGKGLQAAGHSVQIVTDASFEGFVRGHGLGFAALRADPMQALQNDITRVGSHPVRLIRWMESHFKSLARDVAEDLLRACRGSDGLLYSSLAFAAYHVAEALRIPTLAAYLQPITPTGEFASPSMPNLPGWLPLRGAFNRLGWVLTNQAFYSMIRGVVDECRKDILGLPPVKGWWFASLPFADIPIIYGYSRHVLPKPSDWADDLHVTGYWFLDEAAAWTPPAGLVDFLAAGPPPVYVGLGSMVDKDAEQVTGRFLEALRRTGLRAVLLGGWAGLGTADLPASVCKVDSVPHDWLFPQMAAIVHHGGAGTTAAALRTGVPSVVVPYFADQPFWAGRVHTLGVGPQPVPRRRLTADRLAQALTITTQDAAMRSRSRNLGEKIRREDGVGNAVKLVERYLR